MQTTPVLLAIIVCDEIVRDERTHKEYLLGLFNTIHAHVFPCVHPRLNVFVSLTNGHGTAPSELRLVHRDGGETLASTKGSVQFANPLALVNVNFEISNIGLPRPGRYSFDFLCHGEMIGSRPFDVALQQAPPAAEPPPA